jgi:hypothetical protein
LAAVMYASKLPKVGTKPQAWVFADGRVKVPDITRSPM